MSCGKQIKLNISIEFHLPFFFYFGSSNLFLPAISKIWPAFGHWQPAISSPEISLFSRLKLVRTKIMKSHIN
jgi:hypothetical protein